MITVTEQSTGLRYRAGDAYRWNPNESYRFRGAASYITGSRAFKVGINHNHGWEFQRNFDNQPVSYRFNNGVPNQITMRAFPYNQQNDVTHDFGLFAQDSWKITRLTAGFGLRYDYFASAFPEQRLEPAPLTPRRNIVFPATPNLRWHDVSPKLAAAYDLFGTGKTAVKVGLNKYLEGMAVNGVSGDPNPLNNLVTSTTRSWNDANRDFVPQCDLLLPAANGECGAMANANFGTLIPGATYDPDLIRGSGRRGFNWEFSAGVQHEILPRVSLDVGYFRRSYGNFVVTDDRIVGAADFDRFSVLAPAHPGLPGGGGYAVDGLYNLNPSRFGLPADNFVTRARRFGDQTERWNGVDVTMNARPRSGLTLQGGVSTGKTTTDNCEIVAKLDNPSPLYCHVESTFDHRRRRVQRAERVHRAGREQQFRDMAPADVHSDGALREDQRAVRLLDGGATYDQLANGCDRIRRIGGCHGPRAGHRPPRLGRVLFHQHRDAHHDEGHRQGMGLEKSPLLHRLRGEGRGREGR